MSNTREYRCPGCGDLLDDKMEHTTHGGAVCLSAERDALRADNERLRGLLADIRAEGRITGGIAKRLIAALAGEGS